MNCIIKNGKRLYNDKADCCGCGACEDRCPKQAITLQEDAMGFQYPVVDQNKCIGCGLCIKICPHGKAEQNKVVVCHAGTNLNSEQKRLSTSAGIFSAIAAAFLQDGGAVCGAAMEIIDGVADVRHILIRSLDELPKLQGSKYVQSDVNRCYAYIRTALDNGKRVLFSGTPCQVAGVKAAFRKYSGQLFTIDIICHGVPNVRFFNAYLHSLSQRKQATIIDFKFRDKKYGWGLTGTIEMAGSSGKECEYKLSPVESSYYKLFLDGETYRDSCYKCPYACQSRIGDLTIGDYWGAEQYSPELMSENGGPFQSTEGVSCILENTETGSQLLNMAENGLLIREIDINKVLIINSQLKAPATYSSRRKKIFSAYCRSGYSGVEKLYRNWKIQSDCISICKKAIPKSVKQCLKKVLKRS